MSSYRWTKSPLLTHFNTWKKSLSIPWFLTKKSRFSKRHSLSKKNRPPPITMKTLKSMVIQATSFCANENTGLRGTWLWLKRRFSEGPQESQQTILHRPRRPRTPRSISAAHFLKTQLTSIRHPNGPQSSSCTHIPLRASVFSPSQCRSQPSKKKNPSSIKGK